MTIFTITPRSGSHRSVQTTLKVVWAFAICRAMTSSSGPGVMSCTNEASTGTNQMNRNAPVMLNTLCATAVRFASRDCPMQARSAVMVVPMLSPSRMGMEPWRPSTLVTPSGPGCEAKLCSTAMVALELCTTSVITVPTTTPSAGMSFTWSIMDRNTSLCASGFMTAPIVSMPTNRRPNANTVCPMFLTRSSFATNHTMKPTNTMSQM